MNEGDVGLGGLAASLVLIAVALVLSRRGRLRLERDLVEAVVRSAVQLALAGAALALIVEPGAWLGWSWLWVVAIVVFASVSVARRAPRLPAVLPIALVATSTSAAVGLGVTFGFGIFDVSGQTIVPVTGMLVGNASKAASVVAQRLMESLGERREEIEARLALGLPSSVAARPVVRGALRTAILPQVENTKQLGVVVLPGAMTGLILAGVDPLDAVLTQAALMYLITGGVVVTTTVVAVLATRQTFTPDHRLRPIARETRDES